MGPAAQRSSRGTVMRNLVSLPGTEVTLIDPPCASTARLTMDRPRPVPLISCCEWCFSTRKKRRKMCGRSALGMPTPLSVTQMQHVVAGALAADADLESGVGVLLEGVFHQVEKHLGPVEAVALHDQVRIRHDDR